jgi:hypothetical protein
MSARFSIWLLSALVVPAFAVEAAELTGRVSVLGAFANAGAGDVGSAVDIATADQESLRLMVDGADANAEWAIHGVLGRQRLSGFPAPALGPADLFRYTHMSGVVLDERSPNSSNWIGYEIDRLFYKHRLANVAIGLGRQPIDWGTGRFWQPLNVLGAFAPTELDTDYKPGIDAAVVDWYPSAFSSLTLAYAFSPNDSSLRDSGVAHYRTRVGELSEMTLLAGTVLGNSVIGASFESEWRGIGWRVEGVHYRIDRSDENEIFWIAGLDYQLDDSTLLSLEWYDNSHGATNETELAGILSDPLVQYRLQQHLGRRVLGIGLRRDITPLLVGSYTLLASGLGDANGQLAVSTLHQLNLVYSVSNESDLLLSVLLTSGKGLTGQSGPRSEFGHLPPSVTLRFRQYF